MKERIDLILESQDHPSLNLIVLYQASVDYKAHVIEELKNARVCPVLDEPTLRDLYRSTNQSVALVVSRLAGLGKSALIRRAILEKNRRVVRVPLYGETTKAEIIGMINQKVGDIPGEPYDFHLDIYEMQQESLHIILFELLVLRKLHVGLE